MRDRVRDRVRCGRPGKRARGPAGAAMALVMAMTAAPPAAAERCRAIGVEAGEQLAGHVLALTLVHDGAAVAAGGDGALPAVPVGDEVDLCFESSRAGLVSLWSHDAAGGPPVRLLPHAYLAAAADALGVPVEAGVRRCFSELAGGADVVLRVQPPLGRAGVYLHYAETADGQFAADDFPSIGNRAVTLSAACADAAGRAAPRAPAEPYASQAIRYPGRRMTGPRRDPPPRRGGSEPPARPRRPGPSVRPPPPRPAPLHGDTDMTRITGATAPPAGAPRAPGLRHRAAALVGLPVALAVAGCQATMPDPVGLTAAPEAAVSHNAAAAFAAGIAPDRAPPVVVGDAIGFRLSASTDGYGHLYLLNATDDVWVLAENLRLPAHAQRAFPPADGGFVLRATPPAGVDRVLLLVTRHPFAGFAGGAAAQGPVQLPVRAARFVADLNAATGGLREDAWVVAETRVEIVAD